MGFCYAVNCDTHSYIQAINRETLCSFANWRLPEAHELGLLDHGSRYNPDIDTDYFPNTAPNPYWSRTQAKAIDSLAWSVNFLNGFPYITEKRIALHVRLVADTPQLELRSHTD